MYKTERRRWAREKIVEKFKEYLLAISIAMIIAGIYGVIHDQISFTFSEEYFTKFKFIQFNLSWAYESPRLGAALVGFLATWWMGLILCSILGLFGFMLKNPRTMRVSLLQAIGVAVVVTFFTGIGGLIYGYQTVNSETVASYMQWVHPGVTNPVQFIRVGFMHNASYLGGVIGLLAGIIFLITKRVRGA